MTITIEAIYENGVLKPIQPLPLAEQEKVRVTVEPDMSWAARTAGMMKFNGSAELAEQFAMDPDLDFPPPKAP
jgi:predicted DNA-binding antitoxin AbrB/MazE fold protein